MNSSIAFPLLLTLLAGLATGIGSAIAFFAHRTNVRFLSFSLGLSAGVMIYVSFVELFAESQTLLTAQWGATAGVSATVACFFGGILLIGVIDRLVPSFENPHEMHSVEEMNRRPHDRKLMRMGLMTALVIGIHNFPEGIATFMSAIDNPTLGIAIAAAIAIHNIPEGIAVSVPIYYATGSRRKAFLLSLSSGLAEPVGALLAYAVLLPFLSPTLLGCLFGFVAGIMVFISLDELLPAAEEYGEHHISIYGVVTGMALMAVSLIVFSCSLESRTAGAFPMRSGAVRVAGAGAYPCSADVFRKAGGRGGAWFMREAFFRSRRSARVVRVNLSLRIGYRIVTGG